MKIAVIGANGQLGSDLCRVFAKDELHSLYHKDIEVTNRDDVWEKLSNLKPEVVINTAAYHKVDECENNAGQSFLLNTVGAFNTAEVCARLGAVCVFISTDYVFDGRATLPYTEEDFPNPINVYGVSKLAGETAVLNVCKKAYVIRTTGLYGISGSKKGWNFADLMVKLGTEREEVRVVTDQVLTPTYTLDVAKKMKELLETKVYGLYHITNNDYCSWYQFAKEIFTLAKLKAKLSPTTSEEFKTAAKRPAFSVLDNFNLRKVGLDDMPLWQEALRNYLKEKGVI